MTSTRLGIDLNYMASQPLALWHDDRTRKNVLDSIHTFSGCHVGLLPCSQENAEEEIWIRQCRILCYLEIFEFGK